MEILGVPTDQTVYETTADPTPSDTPNSGLKARLTAGCINLNYLTEVIRTKFSLPTNYCTLTAKRSWPVRSPATKTGLRLLCCENLAFQWGCLECISAFTE